MRWSHVVLLLGLLFLTGAAAASGGAVEDLIGEEGTGEPGAPTSPAPFQPDGPQIAMGELFAVSLVMTTLITAGTKHINRDNVLEHDTRKAMHEYLWEVGSAHLRRIATALDLSTTNATWHLDKLRKADLVGEVKVNGYRMYYPKGGGRILRDQCLMAAQVQSENAQAVVEYVAEHPGSHQREIARALDVNHGTARWHLGRLAEAGILEERKEGRTTTYRLTEEAKEILIHAPPRQLEDVVTPA
ncbi:MAG: winged helix-turn-helix transcriptional regulator [Candidatus Thermoplasmatota archaeon]|nr:winged helix-turn-helix transcriptional regulator [Candidatus Thermoplasmatota archaeon]